MENKNSNEDELPKLNIEQENEFKKLKLSIEHGTNFFGGTSPNLPPEIEAHFLDNVYNFEEQYKNAKQITVFEKLGKPEFKLAETLSDSEITTELETLIELMHTNNMCLDVICDYKNEDRLLYTFLTDELFSHKIDDINIPGMFSHFTYEEFHPNHLYDIERYCYEFWPEFLDKNNSFFETHTASSVKNLKEILLFKDSFDSFQIIENTISNIQFSLEDCIATADANLQFKGFLKGEEKSILFNGTSKITLEYQYDYWYINHIELI